LRARRKRGSGEIYEQVWRHGSTHNRSGNERKFTSRWGSPLAGTDIENQHLESKAYILYVKLIISNILMIAGRIVPLMSSPKLRFQPKTFKALIKIRRYPQANTITVAWIHPEVIQARVSSLPCGDFEYTAFNLSPASCSMSWILLDTGVCDADVDDRRGSLISRRAHN